MRLPDTLLIRGRTRGAGTCRARRIRGQLYRAVSIWDTEIDARTAAQEIARCGLRWRVSPESRPRRAEGVEDQTMWVVWGACGEGTDARTLRSTAPADPDPDVEPPDPRRRLPDGLLIRDYSGGAGLRTRRYNGAEFSAVSIWETAAAAKAAAAIIWAQGPRARVTRETRPLKSYGLRRRDYHLRPSRARYMWVVWVSDPAGATASGEPTS